MKAFRSIIAGLLAIGSVAHASIPLPPPETEHIPVAIMTDLGSGQVLYARKARDPILPASMTKVMTAFVVFEKLSEGKLSLDTHFIVSEGTAKLWGGKGSTMYLKAGDSVTVDELLHGLMTASANDGAVALAEGVAGSERAFTFLMNDAARRLGMKGSRFGTANGWMDGGKTHVTANDLVILSKAMIERFPHLYRRYSGKTRVMWRGVPLASHDPVTGVVPGADGIKTGYTGEAGYNFLGSAERDGRRLVMVLAGARSGGKRAMASRSFLEWGYSAWRKRSLFEAGRKVGTAQVQGGSAGSVGLVAAHPVYAAVPRDQAPKVTLSIHYRGPLVAPIARGSKVAELEIAVDGMTPGRVPLYAASEVQVASPMDRLLNGLMNLVS